MFPCIAKAKLVPAKANKCLKTLRQKEIETAAFEALEEDPEIAGKLCALALDAAMTSVSQVEIEEILEKGGKVKDNIWNAFANAFLCDIVIFAEGKEKIKTYKASLKFLTKPFYIFRAKSSTYILYPSAFAKEFSEDRELEKTFKSEDFLHEMQVLREGYETKLQQKEEEYKKKLQQKVKEIRLILQQEEEKMQRKLLQKKESENQGIINPYKLLSDSNDDLKEMSNLIEKLFKKSWLFLSTLESIDQGRLIDFEDLNHTIEDFQTLAEEYSKKVIITIIGG